MTDRRRLRAKRLEALVAVEPGTLGYHVRQYLDHLEVRNYSRHSLRSRKANLRYFLVWADERGLSRPEEITVAVLERYQRWLYYCRRDDGRPLSFRSQYDRLAHVRRFFRWLARLRILEMSPAETLELPRVPRRLPRTILTAQEVERVLAQPDVATPQGLRDRAILETLYSTGLRRQEMVELSLYDVDLEGQTVLVRQGKGKKDRLIPIGERAVAWLARYIEEVRPALTMEPDRGHLFLTRLREPFSPMALSKRVRTYVEAADLGKRGSCHLFRHTMATLMLEGGADLRYIQAMLGHADISTTQIYTKVAIRKLKEVYERTHPGARLERTVEGSAAEDEDEPALREAILETLETEAAEEEAAGGL